MSVLSKQTQLPNGKEAREGREGIIIHCITQGVA